MELDVWGNAWGISPGIVPVVVVPLLMVVVVGGMVLDVVAISGSPIVGGIGKLPARSADGPARIIAVTIEAPVSPVSAASLYVRNVLRSLMFSPMFTVDSAVAFPDKWCCSEHRNSCNN